MEKAHLYEALYLVNHGIDEAVRGVQRLKKSPKLFMETYHKSVAGLERRRSMINLQFMLEMRKLEEIDESYFNEEFNVWLSDEPLTNDEICQLMRGVERERKLEGKRLQLRLQRRSGGNSTSRSRRSTTVFGGDTRKFMARSWTLSPIPLKTGRSISPCVSRTRQTSRFDTRATCSLLALTFATSR